MMGTRAVFVGASSLLIHCAEAYRSAGHAIAAVITSDQKIGDWAKANSIPAVPDSETPLLEAAIDFDFLFCICSQQSLPPELTLRARIMAIRFHDSLSPGDVAPHAPTWALIAQEKKHGVSWREVKLDENEGATVKQTAFNISETETAWSLQAKCYEAGLRSFVSLLGDIGRGPLHLSEPTGAWRPGNHLQRPAALGTLDFSRSARELAGLVAGLDFGPNPNPLGFAKIYLGDSFAVVRSAYALDPRSTQAPGVILAAEGDSLRVATGEGDILLNGVSYPPDQRPGFAFGKAMVLPAMDSNLLEALDGRLPAIARGELYWRTAYSDIAPIELPYPHATSEPQMRPRSLARVPSSVKAPAAVTLAAFLAWLSGLTGQARVSIMYSDRELDAQARPLECWLSTWVPMTLSIPQETPPQRVAALAAAEIAAMHQAGPCTRDLPLRIKAAHGLHLRLGKIGASLSGQDLPAGMDFMLAVNLDDSSVELVTDDAVFPHATLTVIASHFSAFAAGFPGAGSVAAVSLVPAAEAALTAEINSTSTPYDTASSVQELIAAQVRRTPDHEAVCFEGLTLSYRALEDRSTALASRLQTRGVGPGHIVGLCMYRGLDLVVSLLAIWKAGAAYLPLDPNYPRDRLLYMMEDSQTGFVLTTGALASALAIPTEISCLLDAATDSDAPRLKPLATTRSAARAAYLMYTSGSTGRPKGVIVTQQNLLNLFAGLNAAIPLEPTGRWLAIASLSFDISVTELWWTLTRGLTVVVHSDAAPRWAVAQAMLQNEITHFFCTPSMTSLLVADAAGRAALSGLSVLMTGGELLPLQLAKDLCSLVPGRVINVYGPTEVSVLSTSCEMSNPIGFAPLGPPIANTTLSIRTAFGAECPAWVTGELLLGGDGVSAGYWRRPELNAERFITDPGRPGYRLYKTGDLVRRWPDGALESMGRIDHQVKILGHRIELGEIENVISQLPGVKEAVVLAPEDKFGDRRLVAYVIPEAREVLQAGQVQSAVAEKLPAIMVPTHVVVLPAFSLTPNGKVDRGALPSPKSVLNEGAEALPPSPLEHAIAEIWEQVLGKGNVEASDSFFESGGCFFSAVQVQRRLLETTGHFVSLADMTRFPSVRELAHRLAFIADAAPDLGSFNQRKNVGLHLPQVAQPAQDKESNLAASKPTAELTPIESAVAAIWRDLFEIAHISRDDDFFNLGGNSLAAVRMFAQLRKQFPIDLPLATLFKAPTLAGFAVLVSKHWHPELDDGKAPTEAASSRKSFRPQREWSPLVTICRGDSQRRPLFCVHGAGGNVFNFKALSQKFGPDQPVYGLQPQGVDGHLTMLESIEAMAAQYVQAIRSVDPRGPYRLLGYSAGGVIAYEMAQQLRKAGAQIELLAMIDTLTPAAAVRKPTIFRKLWLLRHWSLKFARERFEQRTARKLAKASYAHIEEKLSRGEWLTPELVELHLFCNIIIIQNRYQPAPYQGSVVLFKAKDATTLYQHAGARLGWEAHIDGQIEITSIPGSHNSIMGEPGLSELSVALRKKLNELDARAEGSRSPAGQTDTGNSVNRRQTFGNDCQSQFQELKKTGTG